MRWPTHGVFFTCPLSQGIACSRTSQALQLISTRSMAACGKPYGPFHSGALRFRVVYSRQMNRAGTVRQSVSLPSVVAKRVRAIAKTRKLSANRVLVDLIETGLQARESERERFLTLARRFKESSDPDESDRLREELARVIFGA